MRVSRKKRGEDSHFQWKVFACSQGAAVVWNNIWTEQHFVHAGDEKQVIKCFCANLVTASYWFYTKYNNTIELYLKQYDYSNNMIMLRKDIKHLFSKI